MSDTNTGGRAFPQCSYNFKGGYDITGGMSLRDYFAAKAMQGLIAAWTSGVPEANATAAAAYQYADSMLEARRQS